MGCDCAAAAGSLRNGDRVRIKICDRSFAHSNAIGSGDYPWLPAFFEWDRSECDLFKGPVVFTDFELERAIGSPSSFKVALLLESRAIAPKVYKQILALERHFDLILTYDAKLLRRQGKFQFYPFGGCWISAAECRVYDKSLPVSIIASSKRQTSGHKLRHKVISLFKGRMDVFGRGYKPVEHKLEALAPYRYSIVIENIREPNYFTEKIVDCFATGTVPIYWGCPNIGEFFDTGGIIEFGSLRELRTALNCINEADYKSRRQSIESNLQRVPEFRTPEDWIWKNYFSKIPLVANAIASSPTQTDIAKLGRG